MMFPLQMETETQITGIKEITINQKRKSYALCVFIPGIVPYALDTELVVRYAMEQVSIANSVKEQASIANGVKEQENTAKPVTAKALALIVMVQERLVLDVMVQEIVKHVAGQVIAKLAMAGVNRYVVAVTDVVL